MMDLGATVCVPKSPRCTTCPVRDWCSGPAAYTPPTAQGRFEGSARQLRGAIIRTLVRHTATSTTSSNRPASRPSEVEAAISDLSTEGLVRRDAEWDLPDRGVGLGDGPHPRDSGSQTAPSAPATAVRPRLPHNVVETKGGESATVGGEALVAVAGWDCRVGVALGVVELHVEEPIRRSIHRDGVISVSVPIARNQNVSRIAVDEL